MKILITAFEPFGGGETNSSLETLHSMPEKYGNCEIHKLDLPVVYDLCGMILRDSIDIIDPDAVICLGQAEGRGEITPEYIAINVDNASLADNAGNTRSLRPIEEYAPAAYVSTLPIAKIVDALNAKKIPAKVSFSAGTYVCNNLMYHALRYTNSTKKPTGFIHLPISYDNGKGTPYLPPESLTEGILTVIQALLN